MGIIYRPTVVDKVWGKEMVICNNDEYCSKLLNLDRNAKCSVHYHKNKHETFFILHGKVLMELYDFEDDILRTKSIYTMREGDIIEIDRKVPHSFFGIVQSTILEVSTPHSDDDSYRFNDSRKLSSEEAGDLLKNSCDNSV